MDTGRNHESLELAKSLTPRIRDPFQLRGKAHLEETTKILTPSAPAQLTGRNYEESQSGRVEKALTDRNHKEYHAEYPGPPGRNYKESHAK